MSKLTIGGQAVIEGVMMRSKTKYAIAVRKPNKKISVKKFKLKDYKKINKIPIIRGIFRFVETLNIGIQGITYSASESMGEEEQINAWEMFLTIIVSIVMTIVLFYMIPLFLARFITNSTGLLFNVMDGILRLVIFLIYLLIIAQLPDIKRVFQYHGAEHMTVHCYESGKKLTTKNIKQYSTLHPRCGTNFILIVFIMSLFIFTFIPYRGYLYRLGTRLLLLPLIAGLSYEFLKFAGKYQENKLIAILTYPGLLLQKITTKKPEDSMIKVAVKSLEAIL